MVAESFAPEQSVLAVARRYGVNPNQLFAWRRELRGDREGPSAPSSEPGFAVTVTSNHGRG